MSPHLRNLLEEAADDGGRPVALDLAGLRAAGRRATWRQRAIVGGGALGAAAVITSVVVLAPSLSETTGDVAGSSPMTEPDPMTPPVGPINPWKESLAPLFLAIEADGYDVDVDGMNGIGMSVAVAASSDSGSSVASTLTTTGYPIARGDARGAVTVAEFTDVALLVDAVAHAMPGGSPPQPCAVLPPDAALVGFAWGECVEEQAGDGQVWRASGAGPATDAIGVTVVRSDGSGLSITLSTAGYGDPPHGPADLPAPPLAEHPLTHDALVDVGAAITANGVVFPADMLPGLPPTSTATPSYLPPGSDPCAEAVPPADECGTAVSEEIEAGPLLDALLSVGITAEDVGGTGSGGSNGDVAQSILFWLTDSAGRSGTASIGVANSLEVAPLMNDNTSVAWCAVTPTTLARNFAWDLADDPSTQCSDADNEASNPLVVVHDEPDADAIGATLIRAGGSVISVSVSQTPYSGPGVAGEPLAEVPLDATEILEVLAQLDAANRDTTIVD